MSVPRFAFPYGSRPIGADSPELFRAPQPEPIETRLARLKVAGLWVTALIRKWKYDDVPACRLCAPGRCSAVGGECVFLVDELVSDRDAPLYQIGGTRPTK